MLNKKYQIDITEGYLQIAYQHGIEKDYMDQLRGVLNNYPKIQQLGRKLLAIIPLSIRLGKPFWDWYAFFQESENWDIQQLQEFQLYRIRELLSELLKTSKYYYDWIGDINVKNISSLEEFQKLIPSLSKVEFKNNYEKILSTSWEQQNLIKSQTSGTTGMALQFYHAANDQAREWAAVCHQWKRVGYLPGISRRAEFRGLTTQRNLVDVLPQYNLIRCSILNFSKQNIIYFADEIRKNIIEFFHGYPSALYLLASEIIHHGISFPQPKAILLASEMVFDWQVDRIQEVFPNAKIFAFYGCAERTVLAGWCEHRQEYHVMPQYGFFEIDDKTSEIIGTNLFNEVNGFVRYRMTDSVIEISSDPCPDCHRPYTPRLIKLGGRTEDFLFSPENGWIPPAIVTYPLKSLKAIREVQFYQKETTEICIRYTSYAEDNSLLFFDLENIKSGLHHLFGTRMNLKFEPVDDFKRGQTGKFKWIICELEGMPSRFSGGNV